MNQKQFKPINSILLTYLLLVLILAGFLVGGFYLAVMFTGLLPGFGGMRIGPSFSVIAVFIIITMLLVGQIGKMQLGPVDDMIEGMEKVSQGDFSVRVDESQCAGDIGKLVHSFNDMVQELSGIEMFRKDFINNFSHEFKTPIVSIRGFARQLERDDITDAQRKEYASIIVQESERLSGMASNILLLTKLENQQIVSDKVEYSLDEQLRNCILLLEKSWSQKDIEFSLQLEAVNYLGNEEMMSHIWLNILGNAIKFSEVGGIVEVECSKKEGKITAVIRDHGEGMDRETQKRIFEKFYQGDSSHASEGNGLGLSLVKRIVDLINGTVSVRSGQGEGTTFTVEFPG